MKIFSSRFPLTVCAGLALGLAHVSLAAAEEGMVRIDGSSTVYPITEAVAEEFKSESPHTKVMVGISGTGGGFKKFCANEIDINDASRPIKKEEAEKCKAAGVDFIELPVAYDALTIVVNPKNTWVRSMTIADLKKMWEPAAQGKIMKWNQVRPEWPDQPLKLYGAGVDSGTFDYFTEAVVGKEKACRGDFTSSEDDNVIVQGVAGDVNALGFFGLAYYEENQAKIKAIAIDDEKPENGNGPQLPSFDTVVKGVYQPLARPLFIYVKKDAIARADIKSFINFYVENAAELTKEVGYVSLPPEAYTLAQSRFDKATLGSMFAGGSQVGVTLTELLKKEG